MEDAVIFPSATSANSAFFQALLGEKDTIISDELCHATILDGIKYSKANHTRYKHMDMNHLEL